MRILLDTHTFLWFIDDSPRLSRVARALIEEGATEPLPSVVSLWEMAIKIGLRRLSVSDLPFETFISDQLHRNTVTLLDISLKHAARVAELPLAHRDPFDRMLIAQAITEQIPIVSRDVG